MFGVRPPLTEIYHCRKQQDGDSTGLWESRVMRIESSSEKDPATADGDLSGGLGEGQEQVNTHEQQLNHKS